MKKVVLNTWKGGGHMLTIPWKYLPGMIRKSNPRMARFDMDCWVGFP